MTFDLWNNWQIMVDATLKFNSKLNKKIVIKLMTKATLKMCPNSGSNQRQNSGNWGRTFFSSVAILLFAPKNRANPKESLKY